MSILDSTPQFSTSEAKSLAERHFPLKVLDCRALPGERDQNYLIHAADGRRLVLKISSGRDSRRLLDAQIRMMRHLALRVPACPAVIPTADGTLSVETRSAAGAVHCVRLVSYLDGPVMAELAYRAPELLESLGRSVADMTTALSDFDDAALHRELHWDLARGAEVVSRSAELVRDERLRKSIDGLAGDFDRYAAPIAGQLPKSVIHNDANDGNVIVAPPAGPGQAASRVAGIIDFGDAVYSWTIGELAIAMAYAILDQADPVAAAARVIAGYASRRPISDDELAVLFGLVGRRLSMSVVIAAEQCAERPDDPYLAVSQEPIRRTLPRLREIPYRLATALFRVAAGRPAVLQLDPVRRWLLDHRASFAFPLEMDVSDSVAVVDLSAGSPLLSGDVEAIDEPAITRAIQRELVSRGATMGVGRYLEPRLLYQAAQFGGGGERRTVHLGIDLFAPAGTVVRAALDGMVHTVHTCDLPLDYGTLVILEHATDAGIPFYTLYGHLAPPSPDRLRAGDAVAAGQAMASLGEVAENGGWTPHLHFQIALDLLDFHNDFPGVCRASQVEAWQALCPDPNLILNLPGACCTAPVPDKQETLARRKRLLGPSLSVSYRDPVKLVRGWRHFLYDDAGRRYLDAYNNVAHVGHAHPRVVDALARQAGLLNTNTRYLTDLAVEYAERLAGTMPPPLTVCYFLNSASEANELALRLARAATGARDLIVLEDAYHGHTTTLIDISPYKHGGPGGEGAPDWVHTAPVADVYRGPFRDPATAGHEYAAEVHSMIERLRNGGRRLCGWIAESCPSVGGQIIFPDGYLEQVYRHVRDAGGVCIADEVQTGYGRLGRWFYGFQSQEVVPDIVVLGKPIGNGHPIAAVVTTPEIAAAFDNGMEFFSTYGGNTVSSAVGLAVLDVLDDERLQQNAIDVGDALIGELGRLPARHRIVGDVRGRGFFLGVELVRHRETLEPAAEEAAFVANRMRDRGILLGTDGPFHNVIKIRPPMTFTRADAEFLVHELDACLGEVGS